jgi:hypothetical protein
MRTRTLLLEGGLILATIVLGAILNNPAGYCIAGVMGVAFLVAWWFGKEEGEEVFEARGLFGDSVPSSAERQPQPVITGRVLAVFWERKDESRDGDFYVKMNLVDQIDAPCTVSSYWMTLTVGGHERRCIGFPAPAGIIRHRAVHDPSRLQEAKVEPLTIDYDRPLKRGLPLEGWIKFHVMECLLPEPPPSGFWVMDMKMVVEDSLGGKHPFNLPSGTILPGTFSRDAAVIEANLQADFDSAPIGRIYLTKEGVWSASYSDGSDTWTGMRMRVSNLPLKDRQVGTARDVSLCVEFEHDNALSLVRQPPPHGCTKNVATLS